MNGTGLKVIIIGGGLGGLCLANGLKKSGVACEVYERDVSPTARSQGYRIRISPDGSSALHSCLTEDLFNIFVQTCGKGGGRFAFVTDQLETLLSIPDTEKPDEIRANRSVSRVILRKIMLLGLGDIVKFDKKFARYEQSTAGVTAYFEDGGSASGDLIVGADGVNSKVREQFLPHAAPISTGAVGIGAKLPLSNHVKELLSPDSLSGAALVLGSKGRSMFVARQEFEQRPAITIEPGADAPSHEQLRNLLTDDTESYAFWGFLTRRESLGPDFDPGAIQPTVTRDAVLALTEGWHERLRQLISEGDPSTMAAWPMRSAPVVAAWETTNVTLLGDAIHSMPPTGGIGGNTALRDAELLTTKLVSVQRDGVPMQQAVHEYESKMFEYAFDSVRSSTRLLETATSDNPIGLAGRKAFFRIIDKMPGVKRKMFSR